MSMQSIKGSMTLSDLAVAFSGRIAGTGLFTGAAGDNIAIGNVLTARFTSGSPLTGMVPAGGGTVVDGQIVVVENATGADFGIRHDNASSSAANRILCPGSANMNVPANGGVVLKYSIADSRWRVMSIAAASAAAGAVATDVIWDAKGDLAVGTGADTAVRLAVGANGYTLTPDSAATTGLRWEQFGQNLHVIVADATIVAGFSVYVARYSEVASGITLTIGADADLEIG